MSIYKINPNDTQTFTVVTNPQRHYVSSSIDGVIGSVNVFARRSNIEKETTPLSSFIEATHDDVDISSTLRTLQQVGSIARITGSTIPYILTSSQKFPGMLSDYFDKVSQQSVSPRKQKVLDIIRFTPSFELNSNTLRKLIIKDQLSSRYRTVYPSAHWAYTNYNSLNFFTSSTVPTSSCLLYPNINGGPIHEGYVTGTYVPSGAFSIDFYIKPSYRPDQFDGVFHAGTILHLSSTYALSLVSGSAKDENGLPVNFRLQLQLSHSADIPPSQIVPVGRNNATSSVSYGLSDLVFLSDDDSLQYNKWHHVVVRWGTRFINDGTGSFVVDRKIRGQFNIQSSTIAPQIFSASSKANPDALIVGNYYEGQNTGVTSQAYFFSNDVSLRDGLNKMIDDVGGINEPLHYAFNHPLNAEIHDLSIKRYYESDTDITYSSSVGPKSIDSDSIAFYLPPFFVAESPFRRSVAGYGGVPQTPFFEVDGSTNDPFNVALSFGVGGHYINIENFLRDFASNNFPRVHHMSATILSTTTEALSANEFLYDQSFVRRRNLFILPCDDGLFVPSFELLVSESLQQSFVDDCNVQDHSLINLDELVSTSSLLFQTDFNGDFSYTNEAIGFTPEQPGLLPGRAFNKYVSDVANLVSSGTYDPGIQMGAPLVIYQRTRDASSNQVTFFDISNLYYGKRILPGSVVINDKTLSGSGGRIGITLKDNGQGTLYRADCLSSASTWNSVGTVFYDEGLIAIKSPHLYFFGKENFDISFKGEQNIHVLSLDVIAPANQLNSSSNPNYVKVPPTSYPNDPEKEFVYINSINFHDENFNVIMKTQLAQPIMKRPGSRIQFNCKIDF